MKIYLDFDGPILDVRERSWHVHSKLVTLLGGMPFGDVARHWSQKQVRTNKGVILEECGIDPEKEDEYLKAYIAEIEKPEHLERDVLIPGVTDTLVALSKDHTLVLVTLRKNTQTAREQIARLGVDTYFAELLIGGESDNETTDQAKTRMIKAEAEKTGELGVVLVGDTEGEILAAQALGIPSVAVLGGIRSESYLQQFSPTYTIGHISELPAILQRLE